MFSDEPYRRSLRPTFGRFFRECHARAHLQAREPVVQDAIAMEIDLLTIARLDESELARRIEPYNRSDGGCLVVLGLPLHTANLILQLPPCVFKGIVDRECKIGVPFVPGRCPLYVHLAAVWKQQPNMDLVKSACSVMLARTFQHNAAGGYAAPPFLKVRHPLYNGLVHLRARLQTLEIDFRCCLHHSLPNKLLSLRTCGAGKDKVNAQAAR